MERKIKKLEKMVDATNSAGHKIVNVDAEYKEIHKLNPISTFTAAENKFQETINKYYAGKSAADARCNASSMSMRGTCHG